MSLYWCDVTLSTECRMLNIFLYFCGENLLYDIFYSRHVNKLLNTRCFQSCMYNVYDILDYVLLAVVDYF